MSRTALLASFLISANAVIFISTVSPQANASDDLTGVASVIDGDTIEIHGERVRFGGIDAPEARQNCKRDGEQWRCGQAASHALDKQIGGKLVRCAVESKDRYGRWIAECFRQGESISRWLVRNGWALDWPRYSDGRFAADQAAASDANQGIWESEFQDPWEWRQQRR